MSGIKSNILTFNNFMKDYDPSKNTGVKFMTIYEKTAIVGLRKQQIVNGAGTYLTDAEKRQMSNSGDLDELVMTELKLKKIPFIVDRTMPDQTHEYFRIEDLLIM
jgi:hypothetical protein